MTSTDHENMEGLKGAYAKVILNTTKEAAARVLAAEFRARRLEKQLAFTSDEATRLLVRLKKTLDETIKEAMSTSLSLQQKIDELESQLNEAEGIVIDLRAELNQVQKQLVEEKNKKRLQMGCNNYDESHNVAATGNDSNNGLSTPSLDALPELIIGNDKTLRSNVGMDDLGHGLGERASTLHESVSVIRKSQRKRKLKVWDDAITTLGSRRSGQAKKPRHAFLTSLSCCTTTSIAKQSVASDDEDRQPQVEEEEEVEIEEKINNNTPEDEELIDDDKLVAATTEVSDSETDDETGGGGATTASKFKRARRKLFRYAFGKKWKNLSTIYPEKGSCEHSSLLNKGSDR